EEDPLQDLLRRHRRLALQRARLQPRIAVLRQLAVHDPGNPVWSDQLRTLERARLLQIEELASEAIRHNDAEAIARLIAEIDSPGWADPPPQRLVQSLRNADAQFHEQQFRANLEDLRSRLENARSARDTVQGRLLRKEWERLAKESGLPPDD